MLRTIYKTIIAAAQSVTNFISRMCNNFNSFIKRKFAGSSKASSRSRPIRIRIKPNTARPATTLSTSTTVSIHRAPTLMFTPEREYRSLDELYPPPEPGRLRLIINRIEDHVYEQRGIMLRNDPDCSEMLLEGESIGATAGTATAMLCRKIELWLIWEIETNNPIFLVGIAAYVAGEQLVKLVVTDVNPEAETIFPQLADAQTTGRNLIEDCSTKLTEALQLDTKPLTMQEKIINSLVYALDSTYIVTRDVSNTLDRWYAEHYHKYPLDPKLRQLRALRNSG